MLQVGLVFMLALGAGDVESKDAARLEERILEQRLSLKSGKVSVYFHQFDSDVRGKLDFTFAGDNCRMVKTIERTKPGSEEFEPGVFADGPKKIWKAIRTPSDYFIYEVDKALRLNSSALAVDLKKTKYQAGEIGPESVVDPRLIGLVPAPSGAWFNYKSDAFLTRADRTDLTIAAEELNGVPVRLHSFTLLSGSNHKRVRLWIQEKPKPHLVQLESEFSKDGKLVIDRLVVERAGVEDSKSHEKVWFPKRLEYSRHFEGQTLMREKMEVLEASFNDTVDPDLFTLKGLDLPVGTHVQVTPRRGTSLHWDGSRLVP